MILYRPVGLEELQLIYRSGMRSFPPRLPEQPIFYPVLTLSYAIQIARDWNTKSGSLAGYVTEFEVDDTSARQFEVQQVGGREHQELWVPAESLEEFNTKLVGPIRLVDAYFGPDFVGLVPSAFALRTRNARAQLESLRGIHDYNLMDFHGEVAANHEVVFAHFAFWAQLDEAKPVLAAIQKAWAGPIRLGVESAR